MTAEKKKCKVSLSVFLKICMLNIKKALLAQGKIVTYDVRNYMAEVVEKQAKGQKWA